MPAYRITVLKGRHQFTAEVIIIRAGDFDADITIGKAKTTLQFAAILITLLCGPVFTAIGIPVDFVLICAAAALTVWSGIDYTVGAKDLFKNR